MKICVAASVGGHMLELTKLLPIISRYDYFFITFKSEHIASTLEGRRYLVTNPDLRNPKLGPVAVLRSVMETIPILLKERPDVVITSGATVGATVACLAKLLLRSKIIFIETMSRITSRSLTGRLLYPIADLFFVQWKPLLKLYGKKAVYGGPLL
ncbi:MAG: PssD/Cps14F family polysaccharide biosynthesis glycosyltransferase [Candidatus Aenigmatarchaeota archaeon]